MISILTLLGVGRRTRYLSACPVALLVLGLAKLRPSAIRAAVMIGLAFAGALAGRERDSLIGFAIAGIAILAMNPKLLFDSGFQMSFAAGMGIILAIRHASNPRAGRIRVLLTLCAGVQLAILPLAVLRGDAIPVTSLAANALAVPVLGC